MRNGLGGFLKTTLLSALVLSMPLACLAADNFTPLGAKLGLWESTVQMPGMAGMQAAPQIPESVLAKMTPQQRAQMENMMKARSGGGMTTKVCMTRETLSSGAFAKRDKSCTTKVVSSSATRQVIHVECNQPESKSEGDMTVDLVDAGHIKGSMAMKATAGGQTHDVKMTFDNKWLSADCGDVKPVVAK